MARKQATVPATGDETVRTSALIATYLQSIDAAQSADQSFQTAKEACATAAFNLVSPCGVDYAALIVVRDALKAAYIERRAAKTEADAKKAKSAADMLWSRTIARAKNKGYTAPVAPQSDEAKAKAANREVAKQAKYDKAFKAAKAAGASDAVAKALAEQAVDARKQKTAAEKPVNTDDLSDDALTVAKLADQHDNDGALFDALEYVLADQSHVSIFIKWVEAQTRATRKAA